MLFFLYIGVLLASIPMALTLFTLFGISRRRVCLFAALLWLLPIPYEFLVQSNCTGECNIRVDLLLVLPLELFGLGNISRAAFRSFADYRQRRGRAVEQGS